MQNVTAVQGMYVAYFGRAADPAGLEYWLNGLDSGDYSLAEIATSMSTAASGEAQALYPFLTAEDPSEAEVSSFIDSVYENLFNRDPDTEGKDFWTEALMNGEATTGQFIWEVMQAAETRYLEGTSENPDWQNLSAKIEVADAFTAGFEESSAEWDAESMRSLTKDVIAETDTGNVAEQTEAIKDVIPQPGETYALTVSADNVEGSEADDVFTANPEQNDEGAVVNTLATGDVLDGKAGNDTLDATIRLEQDLDANPLNIQPTTEGIQNIELSLIDQSVTLDATKMEGVEKYAMADTTGLADLTITGIRGPSADTTFELRNVDPGSDLTALFDSSFARDTANVMTLTIGTDAVSGDRLIGEGDEADWYQKVQELSFELGDEMYTITWEEGEYPETYEALKNDIEASIEDMEINVDVSLQESPVGIVGAAPFQIVLEAQEAEFGDKGGWDVDAETPLVSRSLTEAAPGIVVEGPVETNLELNKVGSTSQGSNIDITAMPGSYRGIEIMNIDAEGFNNLETLASTDNSPSGKFSNYLQEVNINEGSTGVFYLGQSLSDFGFERLQPGLTDVREFDVSELLLEGARGVDGELNVSAQLTNESLGRYLDEAYQEWIDNGTIPNWVEDENELSPGEGKDSRIQQWQDNVGGIRPVFEYTNAQGGESTLTMNVDQVLSTDDEFVLELYAADADPDKEITEDAYNDYFQLVNAAASLENISVDGGSYDEASEWGNTLEVARSFNQDDPESQLDSMANIQTLILADQGTQTTMDADLVTERGESLAVDDVQDVVIATGSNGTSNATAANAPNQAQGPAPVDSEIDLNWANLETVHIDGINQTREGSATGLNVDPFQLFGTITLNNEGASNTAADVQLTNRDSTDGWLSVQNLTVDGHYNTTDENDGDGDLALNINSDTYGQRGVTNNFNAINSFTFVADSTATEQAEAEYTELGTEHIILTGATDIWLPQLVDTRDVEDSGYSLIEDVNDDLQDDFEGELLMALDMDQVTEGLAAGAFGSLTGNVNVQDTAEEIVDGFGQFANPAISANLDTLEVTDQWITTEVGDVANVPAYANFDLMVFESGTDGEVTTANGVDVRAEAATEVQLGNGGITFIGSAADDEVTGGAGSDVIKAGAGDDILNGGNGPDFLAGGLGVDEVGGGAGNDSIVVVGTIEDPDTYDSADLAGTAAEELNLGSVITGSKTTSDVSEDEYDGGLGTDTLEIWGDADFTDATLNSIEIVNVHSNVSFTRDQVNNITEFNARGDSEHTVNVIEGDGTKTVYSTAPEGEEMPFINLNEDKPEFELTVDHDDSVDQGGSLGYDIAVNNVGDASGTFDIEWGLYNEDELITTLSADDVELAEGDSATFTSEDMPLDIDELSLGEYDFNVMLDGVNEYSAPVDVVEPSDYSLVTVEQADVPFSFDANEEREGDESVYFEFGTLDDETGDGNIQNFSEGDKLVTGNEINEDNLYFETVGGTDVGVGFADDFDASFPEVWLPVLRGLDEGLISDVADAAGNITEQIDIMGTAFGEDWLVESVA